MKCNQIKQLQNSISRHVRAQVKLSNSGSLIDGGEIEEVKLEADRAQLSLRTKINNLDSLLKNLGAK